MCSSIAQCFLPCTSAPRHLRTSAQIGGRLWRAVVFALVATGLGFATLVSAQEAAVVIEQLQVDLWPQYDDPGLLVIYKGDLAAPPDRPLRFPIPAGAEVNAVAHLGDQDRLINQSWESQPSGDQQIIVFQPVTARFQLEYYVDVIGAGAEKSFTVDIDVDGQAVNVLGVTVQRPVGASNLQGEPALSGSVVGFQGLSYFTRQVEGVQPGQTVQQTVTYTKPDDALSVDQIQPTSSEPVEAQPQATAVRSESGFSTNFAGRSTTRFWLPVGATVIIVVGLALIGLGAWQARGGEPEPVGPVARQRGRRARPSRTVEDGPAKFCHQCGAAFEPEDRFCAECGARRRGR